MLKIVKYLKSYTGSILLIFLLVFVQTMTDLALPDYMSKIVDTGIVKGDTGFILATGLEMLGVALVGAICTVLVGLLAARVAAGFSRNMRERVFTRVENFSLAEFDKFSTASLITRTTNDIQQVQMFIIMMLRIVVSAPIMGIGGILKAVGKSSSMSWIIAVAVALLLTLIFVLYSVAMPKFKLMQKLVDKLNLVTRESLSGILVVRAFNTQERELKKFDDANRNLTKTNLFVNRAMSFMNPMMNLVLNMTTIAIIWIGARQIDLGTLQVGNMMAFIQYAMQIIMSFLMVSMVFIILPRASVSAERIREVLDTQPTVRDLQQPVPLNNMQVAEDAVVFQDVSFAYPGADEPVLSHISFTAKRGQTTAFIGSTGSGKSTLINLIPRFYDVSEGAVLVDGIDIRKVPKKLCGKRSAMCRKRECFSPAPLTAISATAERTPPRNRYSRPLSPPRPLRL